MFSRIITFITLRPYLIALVIVILLVVWMVLPHHTETAESTN
ncbi:hypothetical protein [Psychromonas arctica]|nr:hypothetical protein [Psychromonas arctica]